MADFYGTTADFTAYHAARGNTVPADIDTDAEILEGLQVASEWLDARYRSQFGGYKVGGRDQVREWEREGHYDHYGYLVPSTVIPREIESATYEVALRHFQTPGILSVDFTPSKYKQVAVDGAVSATFAQYSSSSEFQTQFATVIEVMSGLLNGSKNTSNLSGNVVRA